MLHLISTVIEVSDVALSSPCHVTDSAFDF